jgi:hypothetical protein
MRWRNATKSSDGSPDDFMKEELSIEQKLEFSVPDYYGGTNGTVVSSTAPLKLAPPYSKANVRWNTIESQHATLDELSWLRGHPPRQSR